MIYLLFNSFYLNKVIKLFIEFLKDEQRKIIIEENQKPDRKNSRNSTDAPKKNCNLEQIKLENLTSESQTSKIVSESIAKKVMSLVLILFLVLAFLDDEFFSNEDTLSYTIIEKLLSTKILRLNDSNNLNNSVWEFILKETDEYSPVVNITAFKNHIYTNPQFENFIFRRSELGKVLSEDGQVVIVYSLLPQIRLQSLLYILKTLYFCLLISMASIYFENEVKRLVLDPLEVIIEIINKFTKKPLKARNLKSLEMGMKSIISKMNSNDKFKNNEVQVIKSVIKKISALSAIVFGEAGNDIIKENLLNKQELDFKVRGRKINAIFSFCAIEGFQKINKILQHNTLFFVNKIAEIVHASVDLFNGSIIKNNGDTFALIWKLTNSKERRDSSDSSKIENKLSFALKCPSKRVDTNDQKNFSQQSQGIDTLKYDSPISYPSRKKNSGYDFNLDKNINSTKLDVLDEKFKFDKIAPTDSEQQEISAIDRTADSAVFAVLKILTKINREMKNFAYENNQDILSKLEDFKVKIRFGLHFGWAIEGVVGSKYKIDPSYLSPNVSLSATLEAATRLYDVQILISSPLYDLLSSDVKELCRLIDIVTIKGLIGPIKLFTIDINEKFEPSQKLKKNYSDKQVKMRHMHNKKKLKQYNDIAGISAILLKKKQIKKLLKKLRPKHFYKCFSKAFDNYINGNWTVANNKFQKCLKIFPQDGPTKALLKYIHSYNFVAPTSWKGYKALLTFK